MKHELSDEEKRIIREKEIAEENAVLPIPENQHLRFVTDEVALKMVGVVGDHYPFVYVKETDRLRFILAVASRIVNVNDPDYVDKAVLVFEKGITEEFAKSVQVEIGVFYLELLPKYHVEGDDTDIWIKRHLGATPEMIQNLKKYIIY